MLTCWKSRSAICAFTILLLLIQAASLVMINSSLSDSAHQDIKRKLLAGQRVFNLLREHNNRQLIQSASIMSQDFAFRKAIATSDYGTVVSALANHGARIHADVMLLVGTDGKLIADTLPTAHPKQPFQLSELINIAEQHTQAAAIVVLEGALYQMVVVPVLGLLPIAWLVVGFSIDDNFASNLHSLTALNVSFLRLDGPLAGSPSLPPNRVRFTTDCQFASGCSPPHITVTQLPSATESWLTPTWTYTMQFAHLHGRTRCEFIRTHGS